MAFRRRDYGAWGETLPGGFDSVPGGLPYGFVGALGVRTDADTGLRYMRQRWYDPTLQRFISRDPIGLRGGANFYAYAKNSPSSNVDPDGLYADVTRNGNVVRIRMTIYFCSENPLLNPSQPELDSAINNFRKTAPEIWGGSHDGFEVHFELEARWIGRCPLDCDKNPKVNYIELRRGKGMSTTGLGGNVGTWYAGQGVLTFVHETGHLMGLKDGYRETIRNVNGQEVRELSGLKQDPRAKTDPKYRDRFLNNIMGDRAPNVSGLDIQDIIDFSEGKRQPRFVDNL